MTTIGPQDTVSTSETLTVTLSYGSLLPEFFLSEDGVKQAVSSLGHNVLSVDVDSLVGFRKIVIRFHPAVGTEAGIIGKELETVIREYFYSVWSVTVEKYEVGSGDPVFSPTTTVSLASMAVLAVVGFGVFVYFGGLRK